MKVGPHDETYRNQAEWITTFGQRTGAQLHGFGGHRPLFEASAHTRATGGLVTFEPGARTAWHRLLRLARPGSLDNATVERVVRVYTEEVELLAVYGEQLGRWRSGPLTVDQRLEVERLRGQLAHNRDADGAILTLAENLKATTIDAILAKSDLELGLEVFTDRSPLFPRDPLRRPQP